MGGQAPTLAGLLLALLAGPGSGDTLFLEDGRVFDGVKLSLEADMLVVQFENGTVEIREDRVLDYVLSDGGELGVPSADDEEQLAKGLVRFKGQWMKPEKRDQAVQALLEGQHQAAAARRDARLWRNRRVVESKHFHYEYTVPEDVFEAYRDRMEAYYEVFDKLWKIRRGDTGKLNVRFYDDADYFYQITGMGRGTLAFFEWTEPPYRLQFWYDRLDPLAETIVFHEYGHYLQKLINQEFEYSHWPGESLAEFFSTGDWDPVRRKYEAEPKVLEGRLIEIQRDIEEGEFVTIEEMITRPGHYYDYTWGWSFVYFLMTNPKTAKDFEKFYLGLARDKNLDRIQGSILKNTKVSEVPGDKMFEYFKKCMRIKSDADLQELQQQWYQYIGELEVTSAAGFARAAQTAYWGGHKHRARRFFEQAIATGEASSLTFHRYAEVLDDLDEHEKAWEAWQTAIEMDPFVADYYIGLGESKIDTKNKDEGRRLLKLAQEIEPDNLYLENNLKELLGE